MIFWAWGLGRDLANDIWREKLRRMTKRHVAIIGVLVAGVIGAVVWFWFEPQKLLIDETVNESRPSNTAKHRGAPSPDDVDSPPQSSERGGTLRPLGHSASGSVVLLALDDGSSILRLENLDVENGPDLRVYLSTAPADSKSDDVFDDDFLDLGELKGNKGSQNYAVSGAINVSRYQSAVIWCRRFSVGFAVAPLV